MINGFFCQPSDANICKCCTNDYDFINVSNICITIVPPGRVPLSIIYMYLFLSIPIIIALSTWIRTFDSSLDTSTSFL